jgi:GntR family transcriptional repressor for pyruvate dehydrogenase complex
VSQVFEKIDTGPIYRRVAESIAARITARELKPDVALPTETALALQLGVNRSTVREALRELESRGLVGRRSGSKRMFVIRPGLEALGEHLSDALVMQDATIDEIWETLMTLEPAAAEMAARRRSKDDLTALQQLVALTAVTGPAPAAIAHVQTFFRMIVQANHNRALALAHEPAIVLLGTSLQLMIDRVPQARQRIATAQKRIVDSIAARSADSAGEWMRRHILDFRRGFEIARIDLQRPVTQSR